jgi:hypothetical protein
MEPQITQIAQISRERDAEDNLCHLRNLWLRSVR